MAVVQLSPEQQIMQMGSGYWASMTLATVTRLNLLEGLAQQPESAHQLALQLGYHPDSVARLLRACVVLGVTQETQAGIFALTELGQVLLAGHPRSLRDALIMLTDPGHWNSWYQLEHTVVTGQPAYQRALGVANVFDYFAERPAEAERFNRAMASMTRAFVQQLRQAYDVSGFPLIADIGGGHGQFLGALLQGAPNSRGLLFDLPGVLAGADQELVALGVLDRVDKVAGSFFESVPEGADLYLLKHILHDWTDEQCATILKHLAAAMKPGSTLLIAEMLLAEPPAVSPSAMMDLNMMVMTGGRERTASHYERLLLEAGLKLRRVLALEGPHQLVEATA
ncbi:MAG: methyltransferase [Vulcanimicrobiota bacterium]